MYPNVTMKLYAEFPMFIAFIIKSVTNEKEKLSIENSLTPGKEMFSSLYIHKLFLRHYKTSSLQNLHLCHICVRACVF